MKHKNLNAAKGGMWSRGCVAFDGCGGFDGFGGSGGFLPAAMTAGIGPGKTRPSWRFWRFCRFWRFWRGDTPPPRPHPPLRHPEKKQRKILARKKSRKSQNARKGFLEGQGRYVCGGDTVQAQVLALQWAVASEQAWRVRHAVLQGLEIREC